MADTYIYGGNTGLSYADLLQRQQIAQAIAAQKTKGYPKNIGEGIASMGQDIGEAMAWRALQRRAQEQRENTARLMRGAPQATADQLRSPLPAQTVPGTAIPGGAAPAAPVGAMPQRTRVPTTTVPASEAPAGAIPGSNSVVPDRLSSADEDEDVKTRLAALLTPAPGGAQENPTVAGPAGGPAPLLDEPVQLAALNPGTVSDAPPPGAQRLLPKPPVSDLPDIPAWGSPVLPPSQTPMPPFEPIKTNPFQRRAPGGSDLGGPQLAALPPTAPPVTDANPPTPTDIQPMPTRIAQGPLSSDMFSPMPLNRQAPTVPRAAGSLPSTEAIPPAFDTPPPSVRAEPKRPDRLGPTPAQKYWSRFIDADVDPALKAHAKRMWDNEEKARVDLQTAADADYTTRYGHYETEKAAREKWDREADVRRLQQHKTRLEVEEAIARQQDRPLDVAKKRREIFEADLRIDKAMWEAGLKTGYKPPEGSPRAVEAQTKATELLQKQRTLAEPRKETINGVIWLEDPNTGTWSTAPGSPKDEKMTEKQMGNLMFLQRAAKERGVIGRGDALRGLIDNGFGKLVPVVGNYWTTPQFRSQYSAAQTWAQAVLRSESGAVLSDKEIETKLKLYFPIPGDTDHDVAIKEARRRYEEQSLYNSLGDKRGIMDEWNRERATRRTNVKEGTPGKHPTTGRPARVIGGHWEYED